MEDRSLCAAERKRRRAQPHEGAAPLATRTPPRLRSLWIGAAGKAMLGPWADVMAVPTFLRNTSITPLDFVGRPTELPWFSRGCPPRPSTFVCGHAMPCASDEPTMQLTA
jgi:hypothetical protein